MIEQISMFTVSEQYTIEDFKERRCKAKDVFDIREIDKNEAYEFVRKYHYLGDAKFFSAFSFGIFSKGGTLLGVSCFSNPQGIVSMKGWFGLENDDQSVLELSRLCLFPELNGSNASSFLLGNSIKLLEKNGIRAVVTLADSVRHVGSIYQVCNFTYFGLTDKKSDFYRIDGKLNPRGQTKGVEGVWVDRTRKHRYAYIIDKSLACLYDVLPHPKKDDFIENKCCNGLNFVVDGRSGTKYLCPRCNNSENGLTALPVVTDTPPTEGEETNNG